MTYILLAWILHRLSAPVWCWVVFAAAIFLKYTVSLMQTIMEKK